jgi:hypothetical protein
MWQKFESSERPFLDGSFAMHDSMSWMTEEEEDEEDPNDIDSEVDWEGRSMKMSKWIHGGDEAV